MLRNASGHSSSASKNFGADSLSVIVMGTSDRAFLSCSTFPPGLSRTTAPSKIYNAYHLFTVTHTQIGSSISVHRHLCGSRHVLAWCCNVASCQLQRRSMRAQRLRRCCTCVSNRDASICVTVAAARIGAQADAGARGVENAYSTTQPNRTVATSAPPAPTLRAAPDGPHRWCMAAPA